MAFSLIFPSSKQSGSKREKSRQKLQRQNSIFSPLEFCQFWHWSIKSKGRDKGSLTRFFSSDLRRFERTKAWIDNTFVFKLLKSKFDVAIWQVLKISYSTWWRFRDSISWKFRFFDSHFFEIRQLFQTLLDSLRGLIASKKGHWGHGKDFVWLCIKIHTPIRPFSRFFSSIFLTLKNPRLFVMISKGKKLISKCFFESSFEPRTTDAQRGTNIQCTSKNSLWLARGHWNYDVRFFLH